MQLTMGSVVASSDEDAWDAQLEAIKRAVYEATPKEASYRLGVAAPYLLDALRGADRKHVQARWVRPLVIEMATEETRLAFLSAFCGRFYEVKRRAELPPDVELAKTREVMARLAPALLTLVDKELGR